jgi:UDP-glucose 4-epimerase
MNLRKVVVTGGCGFIGSHLVDELIAQGDSVEVVDSLVTGSMSNLGSVIGPGELRVHEFDINDTERLSKVFEGAAVVFHLAALAAIVPSIKDPVDYFKANVDGTLSVMEAVRVANVPRVIYSASSSCYGFAETIPTPESDPIKPEYPYAFTKWVGEQTALHWARVYDIEVVALRLFNVFGPRARTKGAYGAVLGVFLAQKLAGEPITIVGDGEQTRDFTYVTDVASAFRMAGNASVSSKETVLNVGSGGTYSVNSLAAVIGGDVTHIPHRPGEPTCTFADTSLIRETLGWKPEVKFEEGVRMVIERIEEFRDAPVWTPDQISEETKEWFDRLGEDT